jgi:hypothetical protein
LLKVLLLSPLPQINSIKLHAYNLKVSFLRIGPRLVYECVLIKGSEDKISWPMA